MMGKFQIYKDKAGEFRWRLRAGNNEIVASSGEGYTTKQNCKKGIDTVKRLAVDAEVEDQTV
jgi:uncharacterized protein YegP (UPF0339 family)